MTKYIDVKWLHSRAEDPVRMISEINSDDCESRKIEFWSDGRVGYASKAESSQDTRLGEQPVPPLDQINVDAEFSGVEIDATTFETLCNAYFRPTIVIKK